MASNINQNGSFHTPLSPMRFQASMGKEVRRRYKDGKNMVRLMLARVTKVNYKYNTVEVAIIKTGDTTTHNSNDNGKFSARLPVQFGGNTPDGKVYGTNTLVTVGSLVLVGFLDGNKNNPIVLNIYGTTDNQSMLTRTSFTGADESDEDLQQELWQLFSLYPSMTYKNIDGHGNQEITFPGKTFFYSTADNQQLNDVYFDYDNLPSSTYANGDSIEPISPDAPNMLYVHQAIYDKHRLTFFIKQDGTLRIGSRHIDGGGVTFLQMNTDGSFKIQQTNDGIDPEIESNKFSSFSIEEDGTIVLSAGEHTLTIGENGILFDGSSSSAISGSTIDISDNQTIKDITGNITTLQQATTSDGIMSVVTSSTGWHNINNTVNSKAKTYTSQPVPPYNVGDLWENNGTVYVCTSPQPTGSTFVQTDWTLAGDVTSKNTASDTANVGGTKSATVLASISSASSTASAAQSTADGKSATYTATPTVPYSIGDIWQKDNGYYTCINPQPSTGTFNALDWVLSADITSDNTAKDSNALGGTAAGTVTGNITSAQNTANSKAKTYTSQPVPPYNVGDVWNTSSGQIYVCLTAQPSSGTYSLSDWVLASDITANNTAKDSNALGGTSATTISTNITNAQNTANAKAQTYTAQPAPPYNEGDIWKNGSTVYVCTASRASGSYTTSDWALAGDVTADNTANDTANVNGTSSSTITTNITNAQNTANAKAKTFTSQPTIPYNTGDIWKSGAAVYVSTVTRTSGSFTSADWVLSGDVTANNTANDTANVNGTASTTITTNITNAQNLASSKAKGFISQPVPPYNTGDVWNNNGTVYVCTTAKASTGTYALSDWTLAGDVTSNNTSKDSNALGGTAASTITTNITNAQNTANAKAQGFVTQPIPPYNVGDVWSDSGTVYLCTTSRASGSFTQTDWTLAGDITADNTSKDSNALGGTSANTISTNITNAQNTANAKATTFLSQPTPPYNKGDLWEDNGAVYVANITRPSTATFLAADWDLAGDVTSNNTSKDTSAVNGTSSSTVITNITTAQNTANSKTYSFMSQPVPPYNVGDLWNDNGTIYVCNTSKTNTGTFAQSDWTKQADITANNTAKDTAAVNGVTASTVTTNAANGNTAHGWISSNTNIDTTNNVIKFSDGTTLDSSVLGTKYLDFPANGYVQLGNSTLFNLTEITMMAWVNPSSYPSSGYGEIIAKEGQYKYRIDPNGNLCILVSSTGSGWGLNMVSKASVPVNQWTHTAVVISSTSLTVDVYVNGVLMDSAALSAAITGYTTDPANIGSYNNSNGEPWNGGIVDASIWNTALTKQQIQSYSVTAMTGSESGLVGLWKLNEGTGTTVKDYSPNGLNGTIAGPCTWKGFSGSITQLGYNVNAKAKTFTSTPVPPYNVGDLYNNGSTVYICTTAKPSSGAYASGDFVLAGDVTSQNTAADTSKVNGVSASTVTSQAANGDAAHTKITNDVGSGTIETTSGAQSKVDAVVVGGTNLLTGTKDMSGNVHSSNNTTTTYNGFTIAQSVGPSTGYIDTFQELTPNLEPGQYTVSFYAMASANCDITNYFYNANNTTNAVSSTGQTSTSPDGNCTVSITTAWQRYWVTWTTTSSGVTQEVLLGRNSTSGVTVSIAGVKFERGNKATDWSPEPSENVDNLVIGGTNLLTGTANFTGWSQGGGAGAILDPSMMYNGLLPSKASAAWAYYFQNYTVEQGKTYTFSAWVQSNVSMTVGCYTFNGNGENLTNIAANTWTRFIFTFTVDGTTHAAGSQRFRIESANPTSTNFLWVCGYKLEEGNKVTGWSANPSDNVVGGRNYLLNTSNMNDLTNWQLNVGSSIVATLNVVDDSVYNGVIELDVTTNSTTSGSDYIVVENVGITLPNGKFTIGNTYTLSFLMKNALPMYVMFADETGANAVAARSATIPVNSNWERYVYTFTATATGNSPLLYFSTSDNTDTGTVYITEVQLEDGPSASGYRPAIEDVNNAIKTNSDSIFNITQGVFPDAMGQAIVSQVTNSTDYTSTINGLVTQTAFAQNNSDVSNQISQAQTNANNYTDTQIQGIDFSPYTTNERLTQTQNAITAQFSQSGGVNLLVNSVGYSSTDFWNVTLDSGGSVTTSQDPALAQFGSNSGFELNGGTLTQTVTVTPNVPYTLGVIINKGSAGDAYMQVDDGQGTVNKMDFQAGTAYAWPTPITTTVNNADGTTSETTVITPMSIDITPKSNKLTVTLYGAAATGGVIFTCVMLNIGSQPFNWQMHMGEAYNSNVTFNDNGITVSHTDSNGNPIGLTVMSYEKFAGYQDVNGDGTIDVSDGSPDEIFRMDSDTFVMKSATIGPVKMIQVTAGGYNGIAFVKSS